MPITRSLMLAAAAALATSAATAGEPVPQWLVEAQAMVPEGYVAGRVYRYDEEALTAAVAVFPEGADRPHTPGSAFDPGLALTIRLERGPKGLGLAEAVLAPRSADDRLRTANEDYFHDLLGEFAEQRQAEPEVEPCAIWGWTMDESSAGTALRAGPDDGAAILGRLAPPNRDPVSEAGSPDGYYAEFRITGYRDGWFRVADPELPGERYGDAVPGAQTYRGEGWIKATEVGAAYANTNMPVMRLLAYPHIDAPDYEPREEVAGYRGDLSIDGTLMRLHACSGNWGLTSSRDNQRGWWRGICSNQVTNCS